MKTIDTFNSLAKDEQLCNKHIVTNPVKIVDWKYTETENPIAYLTGTWDGKNSDLVVAEDVNGKKYIAHFCEGFMDGSEFKDWYDVNDYSISDKIVRWMPIPE